MSATVIAVIVVIVVFVLVVLAVLAWRWWKKANTPPTPLPPVAEKTYDPNFWRGTKPLVLAASNFSVSSGGLSFYLPVFYSYRIVDSQGKYGPLAPWSAPFLSSPNLTYPTPSGTGTANTCGCNFNIFGCLGLTVTNGTETKDLTYQDGLNVVIHRQDGVAGQTVPDSSAGNPIGTGIFGHRGGYNTIDFIAIDNTGPQNVDANRLLPQGCDQTTGCYAQK